MSYITMRSGFFGPASPDRASPAWFCTQATEKAHALNKSIFRHRTSHGMAFKWMRPDGTMEEITDAPGLFQLLLWQWRMISHRLHNEKGILEDDSVTLNMIDLNNLRYAFQEVSQVLGEQELCELLCIPMKEVDGALVPKRIHVVAYGTLTVENLHLTVTSCTTAARAKIESQSGEINTTETVVTRTIVADRDPEHVARERELERARLHERVRQCLDKERFALLTASNEDVYALYA